MTFWEWADKNPSVLHDLAGIGAIMLFCVLFAAVIVTGLMKS